MALYKYAFIIIIIIIMLEPVLTTNRPAVQLAQELKSIPVDWAVGLHRNRDEFIL